jgi:hypothetical protein
MGTFPCHAYQFAYTSQPAAMPTPPAAVFICKRNCKAGLASHVVQARSLQCNTVHSRYHGMLQDRVLYKLYATEAVALPYTGGTAPMATAAQLALVLL